MSFNRLPLEIKVKILENLQIWDLFNCKLVSKSFYEPTKDVLLRIANRIKFIAIDKNSAQYHIFEGKINLEKIKNSLNESIYLIIIICNNNVVLNTIVNAAVFNLAFMLNSYVSHNSFRINSIMKYSNNIVKSVDNMLIKQVQEIRDLIDLENERDRKMQQYQYQIDGIKSKLKL